MDTGKILSELRAERNRINEAIAALEALDRATPSSSPRPQAQVGTKFPAKQSTANQAGNGRRRLSPAARKRISEAAKKRWAERRKAAKAS